MIHERLDLDRWISAYPLSGMDRNTDLCSSITGPLPVAYLEQIRTSVKESGGDLGRAVPVDLCIWNFGEAPRRETTKIGGIPYWPADEAWPTFGEEEPYTFVAQFCFADSGDLEPDLSEHILSILAAGSDYQDIEFRWLPRGEKLLPANEMPKPAWHIAPCHAVLHRTVEYPDASSDLFRAYPFPLRRWCKRFPTCSKIGGTWELRGELPDPAEVSDPESREELEESWERVRQRKDSFFCQLASLQASDRQPFLNVEQSTSRADLEDLLMIADVGGYDFFNEDEATVGDWWC